MFSLDSDILKLIFAQVLIFNFVCGIINLICIYNLRIKLKAMDLSTHTIEYRDPHGLYDDELKLSRDSNGIVSQDLPDQEKFKEVNIDKLNKFIDEEGVIL